jgi:hypothetical protein
MNSTANFSSFSHDLYIKVGYGRPNPMGNDTIISQHAQNFIFPDEIYIGSPMVCDLI